MAEFRLLQFEIFCKHYQRNQIQNCVPESNHLAEHMTISTYTW